MATQSPSTSPNRSTVILIIALVVAALMIGALAMALIMAGRQPVLPAAQTPIHFVAPKIVPSIVGKWQTSGGVMEFFADGTLAAKGTPAKYTLLDNRRIKLEIQGWMGPEVVVGEYILSGDTLTLKDEATGSSETWQRVKPGTQAMPLTPTRPSTATSRPPQAGQAPSSGMSASSKPEAVVPTRTSKDSGSQSKTGVASTLNNLRITEQAKLSLNGGQWFLSLSPNGQWLLVEKDKNLCVFQVSPFVEQWCVSEPDPIDRAGVAWSPDSQQVAFTEEGRRFFYESDIWVLRLNDHTLVNLTDDNIRGSNWVFGDQVANAMVDIFPVWSPDGQRIVFARSRKDIQTTQLFWIPARGGEPRKLVDVPGNEFLPIQFPMLWSRDGRKLVFSVDKAKYEDPDDGVYMVDSDGRNLKKIIAHDGKPGWVAAVDLSADGALALIRHERLEANNSARTYSFLEMASGRETPLEGVQRSDGVLLRISNARFSSDGSHLLMVVDRDDRGITGISEPGLVIRRMDTSIMHPLSIQPDLVRGYWHGLGFDNIDTTGIQWASNNRVFVQSAAPVWGFVFMLSQ